VRVREVDHVDVVAYAGAVGRREVFAVDRELLAYACYDLEGDRNEVRLLAVALAVGTERAGHVEVRRLTAANPP